MIFFIDASLKPVKVSGIYVYLITASSTLINRNNSCDIIKSLIFVN